eukprot:521168_1
MSTTTAVIYEGRLGIHGDNVIIATSFSIFGLVFVLLQLTIYTCVCGQLCCNASIFIKKNNQLTNKETSMQSGTSNSNNTIHSDSTSNSKVFIKKNNQLTNKETSMQSGTSNSNNTI